MTKFLIAGLFAGVVLACGGCSSSAPASKVAAPDTDAYLDPANSRVPFKLTNSYTMPLSEGSGALVDDIDARDEAVDELQHSK